MHLRVSTRRVGEKTYQYAQLVESFRRPSDGLPAHRVIANLGCADSIIVQNLRQALAAAKQNRVVVLSVAQRSQAKLPRPSANLRYLEVAVLLELWRDWGLDKLFEQLLPDGEQDVCPGLVLASLCIQRCVAPGSKRYASQWVPRTALPELLGFEPRSFNNTRIHRALEELDQITPKLMAKLPGLYADKQGVFASLLLDVTDTWFVGDGPGQARKGKTKEGMLRSKVGIVLLCNEKGYPLRWDVVEGTLHDSRSMTRMINEVQGLSWVKDVPLVVDRAMGHTVNIEDLVRSSVLFLTALSRSEFDGYIPNIDVAWVSRVDIGKQDKEQAVELATRAAEQSGWTKIDEDLFIVDRGTVQVHALDEVLLAQWANDEADPTASVMRLSRALEQAVEQQRYGAYAAAARACGLSKELGTKYRGLLGLSQSIQQDILDGRAKGRALSELLAIARLAPEEQREQFEALLHRPAPKGPKGKLRVSSQAPTDKVLEVRVVVYFNPEMLVDKRINAQKDLDQVLSFVDTLNQRLSTASGKYTQSTIRTLVDRQLDKYSMLDVLHVEVEKLQEPTTGPPKYQVKLGLDEKKWAARRRFDGLCVLVAHPKLADRSAEQLCRLYRSKDTVEKDFESIKSFVQLRPVRHHDDHKVRAHVAICMLALLLERSLHRKLQQKQGPSAVSALDELEPCRLNMFEATNEPPAYLLTIPTPEQHQLLQKLAMEHLIDDQELSDRLFARS